jgi:hypothetical protein
MASPWRLSALVTLCLIVTQPCVTRAQAPGPPATIDSQKQLAELKKITAELVTQNQKLSDLLGQFQEMKRRLEDLERRLEDMQKTQSRTSRAQPEVGTIQLQNRLSAPVTFIVNGSPYQIQPGQSLDLPNQPAGPFTFEVLVDGFGTVQKATRTLRPNQTYTLYTYLQ